ncbi:MAG: DUF4266 domain-containing protein [Chitinophagaceae bacterium]
MLHNSIKRNRCIVLLIVVALAAGCKAVKPYQRAYLNDENMQIGKLPSEKFSGNMHTYREGASGGGGGKNSGGCGCN